MRPEPGPGSIINGRSTFKRGPGLDYRPDSSTGRPFSGHVNFGLARWTPFCVEPGPQSVAIGFSAKNDAQRWY